MPQGANFFSNIQARLNLSVTCIANGLTYEYICLENTEKKKKEEPGQERKRERDRDVTSNGISLTFFLFL